MLVIISEQGVEPDIPPWKRRWVKKAGGSICRKGPMGACGGEQG